MIRIYCNENDEPHFSRCINYCFSGDKCKEYNDDCEQCPYYDCNIRFVYHDSDKIIIETDEIDLDTSTCLYNTNYNYHGCGMVDASKETCSECRFFYDNIEVIKIKEETK